MLVARVLNGALKRLPHPPETLRTNAPEALVRFPDWLVLAQEQWDEVERRNQLLIRALAERHPYSRFLFAEQPLRPRHVRGWRVPRLAQMAPNIWTFRAIRPLPGAWFQETSDLIESRQLRRAMRTLGMERPMLWSQDPRAATLIDELPVNGMVYDLTDDWPAFESDPVRRADVQRSVERLVSRADLTLACSRPLEQGARAWSERVHYLPNAVEPLNEPGEPPADLGGLPRPRLGYVGTLHSSRLDVELLARAAELRPDWSFVLIGPDQLEAPDRARLFALENVHYLGIRPHSTVRGYLGGIDICLLPHRVTEFTRSLDPLKLYEYLAAGRPVIATPVGNAPELMAHIATAATPEGLVDEALGMLSDDATEHVADRRAAVANATWEARAASVDALLGVPLRPVPTVTVSAVIVSFNTCELLERCLTELHAQAGISLQAIVVDNASTDGSVGMVRERFPLVELIELHENAGFGRANNIAFDRCRGEYVLLLNSDAFLAPGAVAELVDVARRHPRAAAVGPRLHNPDGTLQRSAWPFPHAGRLLLEAFALHRPLRRIGVLEDLGIWAHNDERSVDFLIGACLLLRMDALTEVGGFDEGFWLYGEEADLQRRFAARDWKVVFAPDAVAMHISGASSKASVTRLRNLRSGQRRFLRKHGAAGASAVAAVAMLAGAVLRCRWTVAKVAVGH